MGFYTFVGAPDIISSSLFMFTLDWFQNRYSGSQWYFLLFVIGLFGIIRVCSIEHNFWEQDLFYVEYKKYAKLYVT